jgi:hypothetical protein
LYRRIAGLDLGAVIGADPLDGQDIDGSHLCTVIITMTVSAVVCTDLR